uniref:Uncharacterized protein n=3 Tax=Avena sativa TaxID=4498 RepID=A0ACD5TAR7_AVESA
MLLFLGAAHAVDPSPSSHSIIFRYSPTLTHMSRRCCSSPVPAALDDEDLLIEILMRIPPMPSSLPRASLVASIGAASSPTPDSSAASATTTQSSRSSVSLAKHTANIPSSLHCWIRPTASPLRASCSRPNLRIRFTLGSVFLGCRDGVALFLDRPRREVILWDPLFGHQCRVAFPAGCQYGHTQSAGVLRAAGDNGGDCSLSLFKLVLVWHGPRFRKAFACLYESESGVWGDIISAATTDVIYNDRPSVLVGNALFWLLVGGGILEFDFERLALVVIEKPADPHVTDFDTEWPFQILRGGDNSLGLAMLSDSKKKIRLWARKSNSDGVAAWVQQNTVRLD